MKRLFTSIGILSLTLLIAAGCGSGDNGGADGEDVTISVFNIKVETRDQLEALIATYEDEHPHVNIDLTTVGGGEDAPSALQARFASGEDPNIITLGGLSDVETYQDYLTDVSDMEAAQTAIEGTLEGATLDGTPYGIPLNIEGFGWMINREIFNQAGVNPDAIDSYQDFVSAVETIDSQKEELGLEAVFAFSGAEDWVVSQFSAHFSSAEFNHSVIEGYGAESLTYQYGDRLQDYTDLINQYNVQPILSLDYSTSVEDLFVNDRAAIIHQGNWIIPTLMDIDPDFVADKLGILPLFIESDDQGVIAAGPSWFWGVNGQKSEAEIEASKDFLDWMYTSEYGKEMIMTDFRYIPAHEDYDSDLIQDELSQEIYQTLLNDETAIWANNLYPDGFFNTVLFPEFQKYLNGDMSWDDFKEVTRTQYSQMR
ncbi:ABC transporter substrate-binding protein [Amphibacillus cookii]|uniref:ABC transporter substrate-binding protein n=1 Tax=Amphibacillus cookii TaxID=767787 RepID=UPI00195E784C|nr:ABC transporter substrate-binding protein [Amphibacillus cookii]MBM7539817.1 raffinose/stachyose/melibiose transport system substrate-binding protein [Amphibacillus cookii]